MDEQRLAEIEAGHGFCSGESWQDCYENGCVVRELIAEMRRLKNELSYLQACQTMTAVGRCRDCRRWVNQAAAVANAEAEPQFMRPSSHEQALSTWSDIEIVSEGRGVCMLTETASGEPVYRESLAQVWDGDHYLAMLVTAPDFGCVQFEVKQ
jgi:hypothetical protein